jgi:hypothetical protein
MTDTEVATIEPTQGAIVVSDAASIVAKIVELASNPNTNPAMFDKLIEWQEREHARQAEEAYNRAMNAAQAEVQPVARQAENTQTKSFYAKLEHVDAAIRPIYLRHGFSLEYNTVAPIVVGNIRVECRCSHTGHSRLFYREAPADTLGPKGTAVKTVLHGGGSTETYLKRYIACGIFNVVFKNMDDDGNRGGTVYATPDEVRQIEELLKTAQADRGKFLLYFNVQDTTELTTADFTKAVNMLNQRIHDRQSAT